MLTCKNSWAYFTGLKSMMVNRHLGLVNFLLCLQLAALRSPWQGHTHTWVSPGKPNPSSKVWLPPASNLVVLVFLWKTWISFLFLPSKWAAQLSTTLTLFCCWFVHHPLIPHSRHVSSVIVCDSTSLLSCRCCISAPVLWSGDGESVTSNGVSVAPHKILRGSICIRKGAQES